MLNNGSKYAQVGYLAKVGSPGPETVFTEYNDNGFPDYHEYPMPTLWSAEFKVLYGNTPGKFTYYVNGTLEGSNNIGFTPNEGEIFSELQSKSDQIFGESSNHLRFWNSHVYFGQWLPFNGTPTNQGQNSNWTYSFISTYELQIWDLCQ
jgi:hypothetical protein